MGGCRRNRWADKPEWAAKGPGAAIRFAKSCLAGDLPDIPDLAKGLVSALCDQLTELCGRISMYSQMVERHCSLDKRAWRLRSIPGVGPMTASAIVATIGDAKQFRNGRELAAWLGLTPLNRSSGGKERLGRITKKGDRYIRKLLVTGMTSRVQRARRHPEQVDTWTAKILERKPVRLATVAMANKTARIIWAVLTRDTDYRRSTT